ncbi:LOW QUALITY PROTEIN: centromere protein C [Suncus etruscus]|uniref:LOW QUALITY PROTEIN: centromere protein C n=1 Tax=Suncus etruscus TaxID=109475 RepID=UPI00210F945F|nr:LOW QUALITY PROTEIN: centromere protein C [Suncus etruscus]
MLSIRGHRGLSRLGNLGPLTSDAVLEAGLRSTSCQSVLLEDWDRLKNDYRRRFCRPSRVLDINKKQGQNIMDILQDCFEENSIANDFSTHCTISVLQSTPRMENSCILSPSTKGQKSSVKSVSVSANHKEASLHLIEEPRNADKRSVQTHDCENILATNVDSKNKRDSRRMSSKDRKNRQDENKDLFVVSPPIFLDTKPSMLENSHVTTDQKRKAYTFENSIHTLPSSTKISLKTKKRLNFEEKDVLKEIELENIVSERPQIFKETELENIVSKRPQKRPLSGTSQKTTQDSEYEIPPQTKKSFSALFLETVKNGESSPVVKHIVTEPPHSSPVNDLKLLEDEFVIDESDKSMASLSWITIPRKSGPLKQCTMSRLLRAIRLLLQNLQNLKCLSVNMRKSSRSHRTMKENQKSNSKVNIVEEQVDVEQPKDTKTKDRSNITQDKLQRNSDVHGEEFEEMRSDHISPKQLQPLWVFWLSSLGSKKNKTSVSYTKNKKERVSKNKNFSNSSSKNKFASEEETSTITRSRRLSMPPSDWWVVKSQQSTVSGNPSPVVIELPLYHNRRKKSANKVNNSSKHIQKKAVPLKQQKKNSQRSSRAQKVLNANNSGQITHHDTISTCHQKSLESKEELAEQKFNNSGHRGKVSSKDQDSIATKNVHLKSQTSGYTCMTSAESKSDSEEFMTPVFEKSGPSRNSKILRSAKYNYLHVDDNEVLENSDDSKVKKFEDTSEGKTHQKLIFPSNSPNVRRTKRIRLKPLEYWRGERVDYQVRQSGGFVISGILSPDKAPSKRKAKENVVKVNKKDNRKRICLDNDERKKNLIENLKIELGDPLQPTMVKDPETREIILLDLVRPRDTYQFLVEHGELTVFKTLDTPYFSTGKLVLGPHQEKGKQHVGSDILVFYVKCGDLLCTLHETPYVMTTGDSFYVPSGNYYNIKNLLNEESVLLFTQIKS